MVGHAGVLLGGKRACKNKKGAKEHDKRGNGVGARIQLTGHMRTIQVKLASSF